MSKRIDAIVNDMYYIIDSLKLLDHIFSLGDCNTCAIKKTCEYCPKAGESVRYNCPHYVKEE